MPASPITVNVDTGELAQELRTEAEQILNGLLRIPKDHECLAVGRFIECLVGAATLAAYGYPRAPYVSEPDAEFMGALTGLLAETRPFIHAWIRQAKEVRMTLPPSHQEQTTEAIEQAQRLLDKLDSLLTDGGER